MTVRHSAAKPLTKQEARKDAELRSKFGITLAEYRALLEAQWGRCAICQKPNPNKDGRALAVDHCHATGRVRGLLCIRCNVVLGAIGDNLQGLWRFLSYLSRQGPRSYRQGERRPRPRRITAKRYVDENGRRVPRSAPGARVVSELSRTFYAKLGRATLSLGTTDEAEAQRRLDFLLSGEGRADKDAQGAGLPTQPQS